MGLPPRHARIRPRISAAVCGLVGLTLTCGVLAPAARAAVPDTSGNVRASAAPEHAEAFGANVAGGSTNPAPAGRPNARAEESAAATARSTGKPVAVPALTTDTDTVTAMPDGTLSLKRTVEPSRTDKTGTWVDLDPTLKVSSDGKVRPVATTGDLVLGGGGDNVLASMTSEGHALSLSWPTVLPRPVLDGAGALYPGVFADVDLKVTATEKGGFSHTLIVKTPQAAANPALATLRLTVATGGVTLAEEGDGTLVAKAGDGSPAFIAPTPRMWDSRTVPKAAGSAARTNARSASTADAEATTSDTAGVPQGELVSDAHRPGAFAETANLDTKLVGASLTLGADTSLLAGADTVFPVYIDPSWTPVKKTAGMWGWVQSAYEDTPGWGRTDYQPGIGYQHWRIKTGLERSYFRVPVGLDGKVVKSATFNAKQVYSAIGECDKNPQPVYLKEVSDTLTTQTTWNNQPTAASQWAAGSYACGNQLLDFDVTGQISARTHWTSVTFGLYGNETRTDSNNGFKRVSREATDTFLTVVYNTRPDPPTNLRTDPAPVNGAGSESGNCGYIGRLNPHVGRLDLMADRNDPDGDDGDLWFALNDLSDGGKEVWNSGWVAWGQNGATGHGYAPVDVLVSGHDFRWSVKGGDGSGGMESAWSDSCAFTVDGTVPEVTGITSTDYPASGSNKPAGDKGTFTVTARDGESGVDRVEYVLNAVMPVGPANQATWNEQKHTWEIVDLPVPGWSGNTLTVRAVDRAGNQTQNATYDFYAPMNPAATIRLGDITGDTRVDMLTVADTGDLVMYDAGSDPRKGGRLASRAATGPMNPAAPTWQGALFTHRGGAGAQADDLWALADGHLYTYRNSETRAIPNANPKGLAANDNQYYGPRNRREVTRPPHCDNPAAADRVCPGYDANTWNAVRQMIAAGDVDGDRTMDLFVVEQTPAEKTAGTSRLYLMSGNGVPGQFRTTARFLGTGDWTNYDLLAPGDVTGDQRPDLWARDRRDGALYQYPSRVTAGVTDPAALADNSTRVRIASDLTVTAYPTLRADGDLDGDDRADLWAQALDGGIYIVLANKPGSSTAFAPGILLANRTTPDDTCRTYPSATARTTPDAVKLCGPVLAKYIASGELTGELGYPVTGTVRDGDGDGWWADFEADSGDATAAASINYSRYTGAWIVRGTVRDKWLAGGGTRGILGYPVSDETPLLDGAGTRFGAISRFTGTPANGAGAITAGNAGVHELHGDIYDHWESLGGARGFLGLPSTDQTTTPDKPGAYNHFRLPGSTTDDASIYWSTATGAQAVYGAIRDRWAALGWENGYLGFPTSDEYTAFGGRRSDFQGGYIHWTPGAAVDTPYAPQRDIATADLTGDGRTDVVTIDDSGSLWLHATNPDGTLRPPTGLWPDAGWQGMAAVTAGNFNGDAHDDLVGLSMNGYLWLYAGHGDGTLAPGVPLWPDNGWQGMGAITGGDFNNDGKSDIAAIWDDGSLMLYPGDGNTHLGPAISMWPDQTWKGMRLTAGGDFNTDGKADLVAVSGAGNLYLYTGRGTTTNGAALNPAIPLWPNNSWSTIRDITAGNLDDNPHADLIAIWDDGTLHTYPNLTP
ncbi:FG-GAP-like repeat-containing protein [Embleya sp. NBC_00896]|uniref:FG-GAP-like repeat-containing protein n=1 Tax=Embleya sp. NBC_00896 TaxID=2975961 RepID=UPI002F90AB5D|nr:FG-GAP-like repeat-containing protein [Embleya sp. NBC_00896]